MLETELEDNKQGMVENKHKNKIFQKLFTIILMH